MVVTEENNSIINKEVDANKRVSLEELELIEQVKKGDLMAFEALYDMHRVAIYRTVVAITNDRQMAEEILQETFLKAFKYIDQIHEDVSLAPWLYRVAVNLAYDLGARRRRGLMALNKFINWVVKQPLLSPEQKVEKREQQEIIYKALNKLEFNHRATLVLFYLQDFSLNEIAEIMDCPVGTVKSRLYYARDYLREHLLVEQQVAGGLIYEFT